MDFHFNTIKENTITFLESTDPSTVLESTVKPIIKFGREKYHENDYMVSGGNIVSRRHCLIINSKDNSWVYDLESTGTYLNNIKVERKTPFLGVNKLTIGNVDYTLTTDKNKLL